MALDEDSRVNGCGKHVNIVGMVVFVDQIPVETVLRYAMKAADYFENGICCWFHFGWGIHVYITLQWCIGFHIRLSYVSSERVHAVEGGCKGGEDSL